ncbi:tetratricopeptide repeat protein [Fulvivirga sp. 29W222]|uniref:histidine kinase n=1 Tax=Fulvivirga marina TaxID=2494733 RepID=A0A937FWW0_9BACT|nr:tetratricopeptide repeat protein [Fulvivirga marina]MBL6446003.1 tetratricopeptide repeat protein [Fulvivirga marina]
MIKEGYFVRVLGLLFFIVILNVPKSVCQNQSEADSLKIVLEQNRGISDSLRMILLSVIMVKSSSPDEVLKYSAMLLDELKDKKHIEYRVRAHRVRGVAYRQKGHLESSLKSLFLSVKLASDNQLSHDEAKGYLDIAATYTSNNQFKNALLYENKALKILRQNGTKEQLAINLINTGYSYYNLNLMDSALLLYNEAEPIFDSIDLDIGKAYTIGNRALVYWKQGKYITAEQDLLQAIEMLEPLGDQYGIADYHNQLGRFYTEQKNIEAAINHTIQALDLAKSLDLKEQIRDATQLLSQLYAEQDDYAKAFEFQNQFIAYKDSIENTETTKEMADLRTEFEVSLREKEIDLLEERQLLNRTYIIIAIIMLVFAVVVLLYFRQRFLNTRLIAKQERKQHDEKIRNLLSSQETKTLQSMVKGQESERKRLAQELHNHFGSLLATIKVNINGIDENAIPNHQTLTKLIDQACNDIRNTSHELNMGISNDFGLVSALKELTDHLQTANGIKVEFSASINKGCIQSEDEIIIYRIIQELVSNVLKHARATRLSICLTYFIEENLMNILVLDNGQGFDTQIINSKKSGIGLKSLVALIQGLNGEISFDSNPSSGTTVNIDLPMNSFNHEVI